MLINLNHLKTFYNALVHKMKTFRGNWNQNDPAANDYIKNRPFYEELKEVPIVIDYTSEEYGNGSPPSCKFVIGEKYVVIWNGRRYADVVCRESGGYNALEGDYPFYIDDDGGDGLYITANDGEDFIVSIYSKEAIVHTLDSKYLPDGLVMHDDLKTVATSGSYLDLDDAPRDIVRYETSQSLTEEQQELARANINASAIGESYLKEETYSKEEIYTKDEIYESVSGPLVLTSDGNFEEGIDSFEACGLKYYKISDKVISQDVVSAASCKMRDFDSANTYVRDACYKENGYYMIEYPNIASGTTDPPVIVVERLEDLFLSANYQAGSFYPPSTGVYVLYSQGQYVSEVSLSYDIEKSGLYLNTQGGYTSSLIINNDGAITTINAEGNTVTTATTTYADSLIEWGTF